MAPHKEGCLGPDGEECRDLIEWLGFTLDDGYRETALPEYRKDLGN